MARTFARAFVLLLVSYLRKFQVEDPKGNKKLYVGIKVQGRENCRPRNQHSFLLRIVLFTRGNLNGTCVAHVLHCGNKHRFKMNVSSFVLRFGLYSGVDLRPFMCVLDTLSHPTNLIACYVHVLDLLISTTRSVNVRDEGRLRMLMDTGRGPGR